MVSNNSRTPDFNRNASARSVGQLYPVLKAKDGRIIDGFHRLDDNPGWRVEILEHIDTEEKIILARAVSNWHRRHVSHHEKRAWINGLAQIYIDQGLKIVDPNHKTSGTPANQIVDKIKKELGITHPTVYRFLDEKYKQKPIAGKKTGPRVKASQIIHNMSKGGGHSGNLVDRHEKEIREKLLHDKRFRKDILILMKKEVIAKEEEEEPDPEIRALNTQSFKNLVFQYQDGLRRLESNPTLALEVFEKGDRACLKKWGIIEMGYKLCRVHTLTYKAQAILKEIS